MVALEGQRRHGPAGPSAATPPLPTADGKPLDWSRGRLPFPGHVSGAVVWLGLAAAASTNHSTAPPTRHQPELANQEVVRDVIVKSAPIGELHFRDASEVLATHSEGS